MELWAARNNYGNIRFYSEEPSLWKDGEFEHYLGNPAAIIIPFNNSIPDLDAKNWDGKPIKLELIRKEL